MAPRAAWAPTPSSSPRGAGAHVSATVKYEVDYAGLAGVNELMIGIGMNLVGAAVTYVLGVRAARR
jgi:hypothetical protein